MKSGIKFMLSILFGILIGYANIYILKILDNIMQGQGYYFGASEEEMQAKINAWRELYDRKDEYEYDEEGGEYGRGSDCGNNCRGNRHYKSGKRGNK